MPNPFAALPPGGGGGGFAGDSWQWLLAGGRGGARAVSLQLSQISVGVWGVAMRQMRRRSSASDAALESSGSSNGGSILKRFPLKAALTAGGLALTGDTIAQFVERHKRRKEAEAAALLKSPCCQKKALAKAESDFWHHDFVRSLRMASYGFLLYGPGSHAWYAALDQWLPAKSASNLVLKVTANQLVLGPCVLLVVFAWNFAWMGKARDIPDKYRRDLFPSLVDGWKFWIPASVINFGLIPLPARVGFMSSCAIFWNFYLSTSVGKDANVKPKPVVQPATVQS